MVGAREKVRQRDEEGRNEGCEDAKETGSQSEGGNKGRRERERFPQLDKQMQRRGVCSAEEDAERGAVAVFSIMCTLLSYLCEGPLLGNAIVYRNKKEDESERAGRQQLCLLGSM